MELEKPTRTLDSITDEEIESCIDGSSNVDLIRELLEENLAPDGWVWAIDFGHDFAEAIEGFIGVDQEEDPEGWEEAWEVNCEWGEAIADRINDLLAG